ncbi:MAG: phosphate acyltransferase PlsX, partial [Phycisphaerales bacterium]
MNIAVDAMGGDNGPAPNVEGAALAVKELGVSITLVGDESQVREEMRRQGCRDARLTVRHAAQTVGMHESPALVARKKRDSSIWVATELVKSGDAVAVVSAGNTGASMVAAFFILGVIKGIERPAIAASRPPLT